MSCRPKHFAFIYQVPVVKALESHSPVLKTCFIMTKSAFNDGVKRNLPDRSTPEPYSF